ncbi:MAG: type II secretory pathway protein [Legionella sp.]|nr:MAG: type II secretory pathway protein [Legionella sp.]
MVKHKGSALLTALFIITLVAIIATATSSRIRNDIQRIQLIDTTDRLYLASQAVTFWAMDRMKDPKQNLNKASSTGKVLDFPTKLQHMYPNVTISGELFDLQAQFNINNLFDDRYQPVFYGLLDTLEIGENSLERKELLNGVLNWLQPPKNSAIHDEWHDKYAKQKAGYFPSQMPMYHISELRLVYGLTAKDYQTIAPFLTVLPETSAININTASKKIILSLGSGIKDDDITHLLTKRAGQAISDLREIMPFTDKYRIPPELLTVESHYFLAVATTQLGDITMRSYVVLKRQKGKANAWRVSILSQSINTI